MTIMGACGLLCLSEYPNVCFRGPISSLVVCIQDELTPFASTPSACPSGTSEWQTIKKPVHYRAPRSSRWTTHSTRIECMCMYRSRAAPTTKVSHEERMRPTQSASHRRLAQETPSVKPINRLCALRAALSTRNCFSISTGGQDKSATHHEHVTTELTKDTRLRSRQRLLMLSRQLSHPSKTQANDQPERERSRELLTRL